MYLCPRTNPYLNILLSTYRYNMKTIKTDILLIEDNPADRELFLRAFQKSQLAKKIEIAEDGQQALDLLLSKTAPVIPKLIILDLGLPIVSGIDVLKTIRNNKKTQNIPVVVFTGSNKESDKVNSLAEGINKFITKPVNFNEFTACVKEIGLYWFQINQSTT